jgi:demethylmenaquinone methyltransferase/2-methoxy-6-polyprenyl-1,4-benzoquinol methylase
LLSGQNEYRYLQTSIAAFPRPEAFAEMMKTAGFEIRRVEALTFGVAVLYVGVRP